MTTEGEPWEQDDFSALLAIEDPEWEAFVSDNLTEADLTLLESLYESAPVLPSRYLGPWTDQNDEAAWRHWCISVVEVEVELKVAGLAVTRWPTSNFQLEIQWLRERKGVFRLYSIKVVPDDYLRFFPRSYDLHLHACAFQLRVRQAEDRSAFLSAPRRRPGSGKSLDADFYRRLLASYDKLVLEGYRNPAVELAKRMNEKHGTVKSWLSRGRKYLESPPQKEDEG